jgi:hypothetical protein
MLPAGVPVIDHLAAWASVTPGWNIISPVIEDLRSRRTPSLEQLRHPEVLELALSAATEDEFVRACAWVREKHQQTRERFGALLPAADVEFIQVQANQDYQSLEQVLADIVLSSGEQTRSFQLSQPPARGVSPGKAVSLPVLFMYGSIGWQLHIRLAAGHTPDGKEIKFLCADALPPAYLELIALLEPAVGTGIAKDYQEFFGMVSALWPSHDTKPAEPIELPRITMLAGCTISHVAVLQLVYTFLGGYLCKDWRASTGDRMWARPYASLPVGLQCYLHGDIQQVAITAWVAIAVWVAHLFPDSTLVTRATNLTPTGLLNWWTEAVIKGLMRKGSWADPRPGYVTHREGAIQRAGVPRTEPLHAVLRLCPSWPAITSGGCREFHHAGAFIRENYDLLRYAGIETGQNVWPNHNEVGRSHLFTLGVDTMALPLPSTLPSSHTARFIHRPHLHFFDLQPDRITRQLFFEAAEKIGLPKRQVFLLYHKYDIERAVEALDLWETQPKRITDMLSLGRGGLLVRDCRELLWSAGRLRKRPADWVDPFHLDEQAVTKHQRLVTHLQQQWATQAEAARQQLARGTALQESVARVMATDAIPAGAAIGPFLTTMGTQITESTLSFTGRSRSARRRKRRELTAMEARTPNSIGSPARVPRLDSGWVSRLRPIQSRFPRLRLLLSPPRHSSLHLPPFRGMPRSDSGRA